MTLLDTMTEDEINAFILKYEPFMYYLAHHKYFLQDGDKEDIVSAGREGAWLALRDYKPERSDNIDGYTKMYIHRQIYNRMNAGRTQRNKHLNDAFDLFAEVPDTEGATMINVFSNVAQAQMPLEEQDPLTHLVYKEMTENWDKYRAHYFTEIEEGVYQHTKGKADYKKAAHALGMDIKAVDNAVQRIRKKIRHFKACEERDEPSDYHAIQTPK